MTALKYFPDLPKLPVDFPVPSTRDADMLDFLQFVFGFQVGFFFFFVFLSFFILKIFKTMIYRVYDYLYWFQMIWSINQIEL